jgi:BirA family biotin operon repressor/biotin-[acetyl-CoA-carboxylase] ligase
MAMAMQDTVNPLRWDVEALWDVLSPVLPGLSIEVVEQVESTNTELLERLRSMGVVAAGGAPGRRAVDLQPSLLVALHQTRGRGRQGHLWQSAPGLSLTFSLALALERTDWSGLSLAVGVAIAEALDPAGLHLMLKWPNDLWLGAPAPASADADAGVAAPTTPAARKLGGVLVETMQIGSRRMAVIGIGINVLPQRIADPDIDAASLFEVDPSASPPAVLARIALPLVLALREFDLSGFAAFEARYARRDLLRGRSLITNDAACPNGVAEGVDHDGALLVEREGQRHRIVSGAVSVRAIGPAAS